ncbi:TPA: P-loop NTPase fold protein [Vibrio vulnificus]
MNSQSVRFDSWQTEYSWEHCKLNNGQYGKFLSSYLRNQKTPLVLNLDGSWGTGKTTFLRQLYSDLYFNHGFPCIYIDAWESDYSSDPLLVIISELLEQLERASQHFRAAEIEKRILSILGKFGKKTWNTAAIGLGSYFSNKVENSTILDLAKEFTFSDAEAAIVGTSLASNYKQQKNALTDARQALETLVEFCPDDKKKVFVLIDELDRCRPSYAIEMLETIKHFFELNNYVFVVATDTTQLSHSIKAIYGSKFDGQEYLSRFFSRSAKLPEPNLESFCQLIVEKMDVDIEHNVICLDVKKSENLRQSVANTLSELCAIYGLSLRRAQQISHKFESIVAYSIAQNCNLLIDANLLLQLLIEFDTPSFRFIYDARKSSKGIALNLPKHVKEVYTGINSINYVAITTHNGNYNKRPDANRILNKYMFSWVLATTSKKAENTLKNSLDNTAAALDKHLSVDREVKTFITPMYQLSSDKLLKQLATCDDYFRFVELATTISTEND